MLGNCLACGRQVSHNASSCPNCGEPVDSELMSRMDSARSSYVEAQTTGIIGVLGIPVIPALIAYWAFSAWQNPTAGWIAAGVAYVGLVVFQLRRSSMRDMFIERLIVVAVLGFLALVVLGGLGVQPSEVFDFFKKVWEGIQPGRAT